MSLAHVTSHQLPIPPNAQFKPVVFVVDDDIAVRQSLDSLIRAQGWQPEIFASAREFLAQPHPLIPSCVILDVSLPDINGFDLQKRIAREKAGVPIVFISGFGDIPATVQAMKGGAVDFLIKPFHAEALLRAIRESLQRSRDILSRELELRNLRESYATLTPRERQVMTLVCSGLLNKQVGAELGISEITVKAHRGQVMQKMKANSLPDLVRMAAALRPAQPAVYLA